MATIIKIDGSISNTEPADGKHFTLAELQAVVGGSIEIIPIEGNRIMVLNEEGKVHNLPVNFRATADSFSFHKGRDFMVGDVLICRSEEVE